MRVLRALPKRGTTYLFKKQPCIPLSNAVFVEPQFLVLQILHGFCLLDAERFDVKTVELFNVILRVFVNRCY